MTRPHEPAALLLRHAPTVPAALLEQLLTRARGDAGVLAGLLRRPDVDLELLTPLCTPTAAHPPALAAAYLRRPEHPTEEALRLLDADPREQTLTLLLWHPATPAALAAAALPRCDTDQLYELLGVNGVPEDLRAQAVDLLTTRVAALPAGAAARMFGARKLHETIDRLVRGPLADALATRTTHPDLLHRCARRVEDPAAAEHLARTWLAPLLAAGPLPADDAHGTVSAGYRLAALASPPLKAEMIGWWMAATVDPAHVHAGFSVPDLLVTLRGGGLLERPWLSTLPAEFHGRPQPELAQLLIAEFADDPDRWAVYLRIAATFTGTVGELLDTVRAVGAARLPTPGGPAPSRV